MANKRINELPVADLPLATTDKIVVSRDGVYVKQSTIANLPVSTAVQTALNSKAELTTQQKAVVGVAGVVGINGDNELLNTKGQVVLPNTKEKPVSLTLLDFSFPDSLTGWSTSGTTSVTYDSVNSGISVKGSGVSGTNILTTKTLPNTIPASMVQRVAVKFKTKTPGLRADMFIVFGNAGGTFTNTGTWCSLSVSDADSSDWKWAVFNTAEDSAFATLGDITQVRFRTTSQSAASSYLNNLVISKVVINPQTISPVCFTFDDGWDTAATKAQPKLTANGYAGTVFLPTSGAPGVASNRRLTAGQLTTLRAAGWDIALDGTDDDTPFSDQTTIDAALQKFLKCQQVGAVNGLLSEDFNYLCYPNGFSYATPTKNNIAAVTSDGTNTVTLGTAITVTAGASYFAANAPEGTTVTVGGSNVTTLTLSNPIPAGTISAATVEYPAVFKYTALTDRLKSSGVRGARLTSTGDNSLVEGIINPLQVYSIGSTGKTLAQITTELTTLKNRGVPIVLYFHEIQDDVGGWTSSTANASIHAYQSYFNGIVDLVKTWTDAGTAECLTFKKFVKKYTNLK